MQIAGSTCKICERKIVLGLDGKFCPDCGVVVHRACEPQTKCHVCGQEFHDCERPGIDPTREAVLPRGLRSSLSAGPPMAMLLAFVVVLLVIVLYYALIDVLSHGH